MTTSRLPDAHTVRMIAVAAAADPRTVRRYLTRRDVKSTSRARIERALTEMGLGHLIEARVGEG